MRTVKAKIWMALSIEEVREKKTWTSCSQEWNSLETFLWYLEGGENAKKERKKGDKMRQGE